MDSTRLIAGDVDAVGAARFQSSAQVIRRATEPVAGRTR